MLKFRSRNALVCAQAKGIVLLFTRTRSSPPPLGKHLFQHYYSSSISFSSLNSKFKFFFCTSTSTSTSPSFTVSYLINNCAFSPETALKASGSLRLYNSQKPDSVLAFFTTHGFSNPQIRDIVRRDPWLLSCDPEKVLLPKFEFFLSKGASPSDIVCMVSASPRFLRRSLKNHIIPAYEFLKGFLQSDKQIITCMNRTFSFLSDRRVAPNVKLLLDEGMTHSNIVTLFRLYPGILCSYDLLNTVEELKQLGFDSSTSYFSTALRAKITVNKTKWAEKIETFKRWGWSQEQVLHAFKKQPYTMLSSVDKINAVMSFWVDHLGWNSLDLVRAPGILLLSLEKRIIPRASVVQFLISKGLRRKDAGISTPYFLPDKLFLEKFVNCFKEDSSHLLELYEEKMNLANSREKPPSSTSLSLSRNPLFIWVVHLRTNTLLYSTHNVHLHRRGHESNVSSLPHFESSSAPPTTTTVMEAQGTLRATRSFCSPNPSSGILQLTCQYFRVWIQTRWSH